MQSVESQAAGPAARVRERRTGAFAALAAPAICVVAPRTAGRLLANSGTWTFRLVMLAMWIVASACTGGVLLWTSTAQQVWVAYKEPKVESFEAPGANGKPVTTTYPVYGEMQTKHYSFGKVFEMWRDEGVIGPLGAIPAVVAVILLGALIVFGFFGWPWVHRSGSKWRSYVRTARASAAALGPIGVTALCIAIISELMAMPGSGPLIFLYSWTANVDALLVNVLFASIIYNAAILSRVALGAREALDHAETANVCEGCGYDLTTLSIEGRCPECGVDVAMSFGPRARRCGVPSERRRGVVCVPWTAWKVLVVPRWFYQRVRTRDGDAVDGDWAARRFAAMTLLISAIGGFGWFLMLNLVHRAVYVDVANGPPTELMPWLAMAGGQMTWLVGWGAQRVAAALMFSWWLIHGAWRDFRSATQVYCYETAFIVIPFVFWAINVFLITMCGFWLSDLLDRPSNWPFSGFFPTEILVIIGGTIAITLLWIPRFGIGLRALRWANR